MKPVRESTAITASHG